MTKIAFFYFKIFIIYFLFFQILKFYLQNLTH